MENKQSTAIHEDKQLALMSFGLNVSFMVSKFFLYLSTGSIALLAETVHSATDVISSLLVIGGIHLAAKKSERFPWGLYKVENVTAVLTGIFIFISAYEIAKMTYRPPSSPLRNLDVTLVILFLMTIPVLLFYRYELKTARELNSPSLMADAVHWKADLGPIAIVGVGIAGSRLSYPGADRLAALVILMFVIRAGYEILRDSMKSLLDASADKKTLDEIREAARSFAQVKDISSLNARNSGRFIFVHLELTLGMKRLKEAHAVAEAIEREIKRRIQFVERVVIHYEPEKKDYLRYSALLENRQGDLSEHFGSAPFVALWDKSIPDGILRSQEVLENPHATLDKRKGIKLAEFLVEKGVDVIYTREDFAGKGPDHVLSDAEVKVRHTKLIHLKALLEEQQRTDETVEKVLVGSASERGAGTRDM
ncbi:MAG TPA: cation diffusion facilitator family transporter [Thermodesulfovibrionales bacterium]|nr:cation diffusion facilitator family transporter [Thermodesulfovibrionales bacterium]